MNNTVFVITTVDGKFCDFVQCKDIAEALECAVGIAEDYNIPTEYVEEDLADNLVHYSNCGSYIIYLGQPVIYG